MGNLNGKYTLTYFDARGRAEISRMILAYASVEYTDNRLARDKFQQIQNTLPLGTLPNLEFDGIKVPQSISIARHLARVTGLAGKNALEELQADVIVDTILDYWNSAFQKVFLAPEAQKPEAAKKFMAEELPDHLANIEYLISQYGKNGFSVGSSMTWADLYTYEVTSTYAKQHPKLFDAYPNIIAVRKTVETNPKMAEYLKNRPERPF